MSVTEEAKVEVQRLLQQGQKIQAIKYLCDTFNISIEEAKLLVEAVEQDNSKSQANTYDNSSSSTLSPALRAEVMSLLMANQKIEAVKRVKTALSIGLKEALVYVEQIDKETNPNYRSVKVSTGCFGSVFRIVSVIFGFIGLLFVGIAGLVYYFQNTTIENSDKVQGTVVDFHIANGSAPVISYQWKNEEKLYNSTTYSTPPAYDLNEKVDLFVNREDPNDIVVDTFSDRWLIITIFGGLGSFFLLFSALLMFVGRKF